MIAPSAAANRLLDQARQAIRGGLAHLARIRLDDHWRGFSTLAGVSDVWVTAFVVAHLQQVAGRPSLGPAKSWLRAQRGERGMWSYGGAVPPDADSTAWCLIALGGVRDLPAAQRSQALQAIWQQQVPGGIATYAADGAIASFIGAKADSSLAGWTAAHPDVTAAAVLASRSSKRVAATLAPTPQSLLANLIARQTAAGFIDAYWWRGPHYSTMLLLRALSACQRRLEPDRARRLLDAFEREQLADGGYGLGSAMQMDPFTTALALESLSHLAYLGGTRLRRAAAQALIRSQAPGGAWAGDYILRIPAPDLVDPRHAASWTRDSGGGNSFVLDRDGLFASTLACFSLQRWREAESADHRQQREWPVLKATPTGADGDPFEILIATAA